MSVYGWGLIVYFTILLGFGYYIGKRVKNAEDYLVAGRSAGKLLLLGTFVATISSGSTWIGSTGFYYKYGWSQVWQGPGTVLGPVLIMLFVGPYLRRFAQYTLPDFFEARYQIRFIRLLSAITILLLYYTILVSQTMGGARILEMALNWDYKIALIAFTSIFIIYSWLGGSLAVVYTDTLQFFIMLIGSLGTLFYCLSAVGGFGGLTSKLAAIDPNLVTGYGGGVNPISMALAWTFVWGLGNSAQPYTITRFYTAKDTKTAVLSSGIAAFSISFFWLLIGIAGTSARVLFPDLSNIDLAFPTLAIRLLPVPLGILMVCALMAAIISSADSLLVTAGATFGRDIYQFFINTNASNKQVLSFSRRATLILGVVSLITALKPPGTVLVITTFAWSVLASSFFVPLVAGIHWKRANKYGALAAMIGGGSMALVWFALNKPMNIHPVLIGVFSSTLLMVIVSSLTKSQDVDELWKVLHPKKMKSLSKSETNVTV